MTRRQRGFTLVELMVAMLVLLIGIAGIMMLVRNSTIAARYTRHVTEATFLSEDKMEALRTLPMLLVSDGKEQVDALGYANDNGLYTRSWTVGNAGETADIVVTVNWDEDGETKAVILRSKR